jgi:glycosyltransferase involved in cell wall biosynthesis
MWSERKGAHDWPHIIRRIRSEVPDANFCLLGTMVEAPPILRELGSKSADGIELVSEYSPDDLPRLLADCAVGIFPSYVEGFGLAVLEQLAAGIPTVAYDTSGPHDILSAGFSDFLVPVGDSEALAQAACTILRLPASDYEQLCKRSTETAASFSWSKIARETADTYRRFLRAIEVGPVLFIQPFSLGSAGGGARILRALLGSSPMGWLSLCSSPETPKPWPGEAHIRTRPSWGKIERSRLAMFPRKTMSIFAPGFRRRLKAFCRQAKVSAVHAIPHTGLDFHHAHWIAKELKLPFFLQIHDDFAYSSRGHVAPEEAHAAMQSAWREADARFVISEQLGDEYSRRYGPREYVAITDGVETVAAAPAVRQSGELRIYFMGLFHLEYEENLRVLCAASDQLRNAKNSPHLSITLRCGTLRPEATKTGLGLIRVRPFSTEADVHRDLDQADLLYLPLPFGTEFEPLVRFSLSTKLITYLGSGRPILYHGPRTSAVYELLAQHEAAFFCSSLEVNDMMETLHRVIDQPEVAIQVSRNALALARERFLLQDQRSRFWNAFTPSSRTEAG